MTIGGEGLDGDREFCAKMDEMAKSLQSVRELVQGLLKSSELDTKEGISLLSLKHDLLLSYLQSLTLLSAHRVLGHSLTVRTRPKQPFSDKGRESRGANAGDLVDLLVENRIVLEKIKQLESKMRYQIEKLVRLADEDGARTEADVINDPLAFRPNPQNFVDQENAHSHVGSDGAENTGGGGIYRPPKLAPVPYTEKKEKKTKHAPVPTGLAGLARLDYSHPHIESSTGLGTTPSMASARTHELQRMTEFEEENMTRLVMTKTEARRRARDEADVALGGSGFSKGRRKGGGLEDEFTDVLRSVGRGSGLASIGDGYEALRIKGRKQDVLTRSRTRPREDDDEGVRSGKKTRFQSAVKAMGRKRHRR